ncbi:hypothetical protein BURPS1106B_A0021 [Burkholderia pseudomallei 1106b]|nr:hypothetical protein BPC006_I0756 [Burkholderia pseudomallei BPC006]EDU09282.1 hypothetical protein BURPS1655_K0618 [Burkholderia pseudomallei 1655]EES25557.1 hypothetical protein BURPS1106B_A0021 [Burkholderia pseudomallei 1106b]
MRRSAGTRAMNGTRHSPLARAAVAFAPASCKRRARRRAKRGPPGVSRARYASCAGQYCDHCTANAAAPFDRTQRERETLGLRSEGGKR